MNGTPSTNSPDGVQPVDRGDAGDPAKRFRLARIDAVCDAWVSLSLAAQGDQDLERAKEKVQDWLSREGRNPEGRALREG